MGYLGILSVSVIQHSIEMQYFSIIMAEVVDISVNSFHVGS